MGNGMQGTRGMFTRIPGNLLEDSGECFHCSIPGNVREDSGDVPEDSGKCSSRFRGMLKQIPGNVQKDSGESKFRFIFWNLACFSSNFAVKLF